MFPDLTVIFGPGGLTLIFNGSRVGGEADGSGLSLILMFNGDRVGGAIGGLTLMFNGDRVSAGGPVGLGPGVTLISGFTGGRVTLGGMMIFRLGGSFLRISPPKPLSAMV